MSTTFAITTLVELVIGCLLVYGFMHKDDVVGFEQSIVSYVQKLKKKICSNIYNAIVKYETKKLKKTQHGTLTPSSQVR